MKKRLATMWILVCSLPVVAQTNFYPANSSLKIKEVSLGELRPIPFKRVICEAVHISPDNRRVAFTTSIGDKVIALIDGVSSKEYDQAGGIQFGPDSKTVVFAASRSNKWFAVCNGREGKPYDDIGKEWQPLFEFSPNGKRIAYVATEDKKQQLVVDGREDPQYDQIDLEMPIFSPDSKHVAYTAKRGNKSVVVLDSKEMAEADELMRSNIGKGPTGICFSPNGKRFAYTIQRDNKWFVVVDGKKSQPWDEILQDFGHGFPEGFRFDGIRFSPDSKHFVYEARRDDTNYIVLDGKEIAQGNDVSTWLGCFIFSPDSKRTAYVQLSEGWASVVIDGVMREGVEGSIETMVFSPDSNQLVYAGRRGHLVETGNYFVNVNGKSGRDYDGIEGFRGPVFSPNSRHLAYVAYRGDELFRVFDGTETKQQDGIIADSIRFSSDSQHWGYSAHRGEQEIIIVIDGQEFGPYDDNSANIDFADPIVFSPDSQHFAFPGRRNHQEFLVLDGVDHPIDGEWLVGSTLVFNSKTQLHGLILRDHQLIRLEVEM